MSLDSQIPTFFHAVQDVAKEHEVIAYAVVAVVVRDGKAVVAAGGGSKLEDGAESTVKVYHSMRDSFDQMIVQLGSDAPPPGGLVN